MIIINYDNEWHGYIHTFLASYLFLIGSPLSVVYSDCTSIIVLLSLLLLLLSFSLDLEVLKGYMDLLISKKGIINFNHLSQYFVPLSHYHSPLTHHYHFPLSHYHSLQQHNPSCKNHQPLVQDT